MAALLAAALLCAVGATAAPLPPAHAQRVDDAIGRCFELRDRVPGDAITLARATLASPGSRPTTKSSCSRASPAPRR